MAGMCQQNLRDRSRWRQQRCHHVRRSKDNPDGYTVLAVAENRQSIDLMQKRMGRLAPIPRQAFFYDSFQGVERFRKALVNMLTNTFMKVGVVGD